MHHSYQTSVRSGHHVNHFVWLRQIFLQYNHREWRSTCRHISGALFDCIGCHHSGTCVSFRWTNRYSCLQMTRCIELFTSIRSEDAGIFTCRQYFRQNIFQFPVIFFRSNQFVELSHHFSRIVVSSWIYRKHTWCITYSQHLIASYLPMHITCQSGQEVDFINVCFVVQNSLIQVGNAPTQRDIIDK